MKRMKVNRVILLPVVAVLSCSVAVAEASAADYFSRNAQGWFWYEEPEVIQDEEKQVREAAPADAVVAVPDNPLEQLERIQKTIAQAEARAVLYPTEENVGEYLRLNQWQLNQSSLFSDVWRRVVWQTPDLDYSLRRPVTNLAVHEFQDQNKATRAQAVAQIANTHGLFFFFKGSCPYCHTFGPILRRFSEMYGIEVLPVSLDGGTLPDFPQARTDTRVATELGVETVPSVFLVDPRRRNVVPVGAGVMSVDELAERIYVLTQTEPGKDY
jgi:conjugal transfer pilus assembly protein TraF